MGIFFIDVLWICCCVHRDVSLEILLVLLYINSSFILFFVNVYPKFFIQTSSLYKDETIIII